MSFFYLVWVLAVVVRRTSGRWTGQYTTGVRRSSLHRPRNRRTAANGM